MAATTVLVILPLLPNLNASGCPTKIGVVQQKMKVSFVKNKTKLKHLITWMCLLHIVLQYEEDVITSTFPAFRFL